MSESFERFAAHSPDPMAAFDHHDRLAFANGRFLDMFYGPGGARPGSGLEDMAVPGHLRHALARALDGTRHLLEEQRFDCRLSLDGKPRRFTCRLVPPKEFGGGILVALRELQDDADDADDARHGGRNLRRHAQLLRDRRRKLFFGVLDEFPAFVYMQRRDYTVAYANKKVRSLYGETENRPCYEVLAGRATPCLVCPTFEVFETGMPVEWEFVDGKGRTFRIYDYPFEDETGESLVMELGIDVTDLKRVEKELFQAQKLRAIGVLAGGIAHDLNNNLVPIIFNMDHALHRTDDPDTRQTLEEALQAANRAAKLVEQVLDYSRQQDISRTTVRLEPVVRQCADSFRASLPEGVALEVDRGTGPDSVYANAAQMQQVLMNLLNNARQAMPDGGSVRVRMAGAEVASADKTTSPELAPGSYLALEVSDTGAGIPPENMDRIFEPFFTTRKADMGTGMGLAVVHSIVSCGGGAIRVRSRPGQGATFTVYLPRARPVEDEAAMPPPAAGSGNGRLLLVDDDAGVLAAMARTLRGAGFEVDTAGSGEQGLGLFSRRPDSYGLVLADQSMPGMSGVDLSARLRRVRPDARVIICTGHVEPSLEQRAREEGVLDFAMKPMTPAGLVDLMHRYCR